MRKARFHRYYACVRQSCALISIHFSFFLRIQAMLCTKNLAPGKNFPFYLSLAYSSAVEKKKVGKKFFVLKFLWNSFFFRISIASKLLRIFSCEKQGKLHKSSSQIQSCILFVFSWKLYGSNGTRNEWKKILRQNFGSLLFSFANFSLFCDVYCMEEYFP